MIEVETPQEIEVVRNGIDVEARSLDVEVVDLKELDVTVAKREFVITGDDIYVPKLYEDAPQWMKDLVQLVVNSAMDTGNASTLAQLTGILSQFATSYVPLNQYTQSILDLSNADASIHTVIETLNSNYNDQFSQTNAQILDVQNTKASKDEVITQVVSTLAAQLANPTSNLGAAIGNLQQTIVDNQNANALSMQTLTASLEGVSGDVAGNATAIHTLNTYVGVENGTSNGTGLLADVEILQKQNDGVIETTTGMYDVMINPQDPNLAELVVTAEPYASWKAADVTGIDTRLKHIGDVYIKYSVTSNGAREYIGSYKFIRTVVDVTDAHYSTDADGFTWALITDQAAQDAYNQALNAYDLADNKRRVFVNTPVVPYDIGDLWLVQSGAAIIGTTQLGRVVKAGDILRCIETKGSVGTYEHNDWVPADSYREGINAVQSDLDSWRLNTYSVFVSDIQSQVDKKSETFYQSTVPTGRIKAVNVVTNTTLDKYIGDLWKNTYIGTVSGYLGNNTEYVYTKKANGNNWDYDWVQMEVPDIVFDTIDTKKSIYSGNSVPIAVYPDVIEVNDMWITGSNPVNGYDKESIYVWNGSAWVKPLKYTDDTAVTALQNGLADGTTTIKLTNAFVGTTPLTTYLSNEIDNKIGVYSGTTAPVTGQPSGVSANDLYLWFTTQVAAGVTYDITKTYKYSGTAWVEITTNSDITNLADLADGKRTVFSGNTVPSGAVERDIWIPSATNGTYLKGEIYQYNGTSWVVATKYSADLEAVRNNLQSQVDGKVDTYYQGTVPTGMTALNNGDYWYCTTDVSTYKKGKVYKYVHATTSWVETADVSRYAFDIADGKAAIFTSTNAPTAGYKVNDMLIVIGSFNNGTTTFSDGVVLSSNANRVSGFTASDWVKKINDTEDLDAFVSTTYTPTVTSLQNQIDGKIESWYTLSTNDPKTAWTDAATRAKHDGDLWYQTDTKSSYWYSSSTNAWNLIDDAKAIQALADAATAQTTADGKISSYYKAAFSEVQTMSNGWTATEKSNNIGDLAVVWDDSTIDNNGTWRWNGTSWVTTRDKKLVSLASDVTQLGIDLQNGTGTWLDADSQVTNTLTGTINDNVANVESKWAYNSSLKINGVSYNSGFGLSNSAGTGVGSEFWIDASRLKFTNAAKTGSKAPFTIDASGSAPQVTFNGKVTFGSGQTGTIDEAIAAVVETVAVGDKNINITDNLIPITSLVADTDNSGYQFIRTPTKSNASGIDTYAEAQIVLDGSDEVYSPYVDDTTISYYYRFGIKGITSGSVFKIVTINSSNVATSNTITITMDSGQSIVAGNWYIIEGIINPTGGSSAAVGSIRNSSGIKIGTVNSFVMPSGTNKLVLGWVANCTVSRIKLCKITADTITSDLTTVNGQINTLQTNINNISWNSLQGKDLMAQQLGYSNYNELATAATNGNTVINGGYLNTGLINANAIVANQINTTGLIADNINTNELVGKTITGGIINGAAINGVVIKASYLDMDDNLQYITNYHLCTSTGQLNTVISGGGTGRLVQSSDMINNGGDAVYMSSTDEWRIPAISIARELTTQVTLANVGDSATSYVKPYNTVNVGHNVKCVKIRPYIRYSGEVFEVSVNMPGIPLNTSTNYANSSTASLYWLGQLVGSFKVYVEAYRTSMGEYDTYGYITKFYADGVQVTSFTKTINGVTFTGIFDSANAFGAYSKIRISASALNMYLQSDFVSGDFLSATKTANGTYRSNAFSMSGTYYYSSNVIFKTDSGSMYVDNKI